MAKSLQAVEQQDYLHTSTVSRVISRYNTSTDVAPITEYRHGPTRLLERPDRYGVIVEANPSKNYKAIFTK